MVWIAMARQILCRRKRAAGGVFSAVPLPARPPTRCGDERTGAREMSLRRWTRLLALAFFGLLALYGPASAEAGIHNPMPANVSEEITDVFRADEALFAFFTVDT